MEICSYPQQVQILQKTPSMHIHIYICIFHIYIYVFFIYISDINIYVLLMLYTYNDCDTSYAVYHADPKTKNCKMTKTPRTLFYLGRLGILKDEHPGSCGFFCQSSASLLGLGDVNVGRSW